MICIAGKVYMFRVSKAQILMGLSFWAFSLPALEKDQIFEQSHRIEYLLEKWYSL